MESVVFTSDIDARCLHGSDTEYALDCLDVTSWSYLFIIAIAGIAAFALLVYFCSDPAAAATKDRWRDELAATPASTSSNGTRRSNGYASSQLRQRQQRY